MFYTFIYIHVSSIVSHTLVCMSSFLPRGGAARPVIIAYDELTTPAEQGGDTVSVPPSRASPVRNTNVTPCYGRHDWTSYSSGRLPAASIPASSTHSSTTVLRQAMTTPPVSSSSAAAPSASPSRSRAHDNAGIASGRTRTPVVNTNTDSTQKVLIRDHVTNTRAIVTLVQIDYSAAMRAYRVCRQDDMGESVFMRPVLRLLNVYDLLISAALLVFLMPFVIGATAPVPHLPSWFTKEDATTHVHRFGRSSDLYTTALSLQTRLLLLLTCVLVLALRLYGASRRLYVEEVLAIRGVGLQVSTYGMFNTLLSTTFYDLQLIRSIVIHDAFFRYQPIFFLSSSIESMPTRLVYFPATMPRLEVLQLVLRGLRHTLYGYAEEGPSLSEIEESQRGMGWRNGELDKMDESSADDALLNASEAISEATSMDLEY